MKHAQLLPRGGAFVSVNEAGNYTKKACRERPFDEMQIAAAEAGKQISIKPYFRCATVCNFLFSFFPPVPVPRQLPWLCP